MVVRAVVFFRREVARVLAVASSYQLGFVSGVAVCVMCWVEGGRCGRTIGLLASLL